MKFQFSLLRRLTAGAALVAAIASSVAAAPLKIAYSDWPGWTAFAIAAEKGWFKEAGIEVDLQWLEYGPSIEAFTAGNMDAVMVTNGDALVTGAGGGKNIMILVTDYSNGNDMVVTRPGINSLKDLRGKKIGVEVGLVDHLLLLNGLEKAGMTESDVVLVPTPTNHTPRVLAAGEVQAIAAWQPHSGEALKAVPGSKAIYSSADEPGLIYDMVVVTPGSLAQRRPDWVAFVKVWDKIVAYLANPATRRDGIKIMATRAGAVPREYAEFMAGTRLLSLAEGTKAMAARTGGFASVFGSSQNADAFNRKNGAYQESPDIAKSIDPSLMLDAMGAKP